MQTMERASSYLFPILQIVLNFLSISLVMAVHESGISEIMGIISSIVHAELNFLCTSEISGKSVLKGKLWRGFSSFVAYFAN